MTIKHCPFCGSNDVHMYAGYDDYRDLFKEEYIDRNIHVVCKNCGAWTDYFDTEDDAANAWNRRAQDERD